MVTDGSIGGVVSVLRKQFGLSQAGLVERLAEHGLVWHQQTVVRVEAGTRSVRATELFVLCDVFGLNVEDFRTGNFLHAAATAQLQAATDAVNAAEKRRLDAIEQLRALQGDGDGGNS